MTAVNFNNLFHNRMGKVDRGHLEVLPMLWNLKSYDKTNGGITRNHQLAAPYQQRRKETEDWGDYKRKPEDAPEFPLIRRMLLGAVYVVHTPRRKAFENNEGRVAKFSDRMEDEPVLYRHKCIRASVYAVSICG